MRAVAGAFLPVLPDEAYYWTWSRALAWSYLDHPPGVAVWIAGGTWAAGDGLFGLRGPPFVSSVITAVAVADAAAQLARSRGVCPAAARCQALLLLIGAPMFALGGLVATPDALLASVLAVGAAALTRGLTSGSPGALWTAAATLTSAGLVKHAGGVVALGVFVGALTSARGRWALRHPASLGGVLIAGGPLLVSIADDLARGGAFRFQFERISTPGGDLIAAPLLVAAAVAVTASPLGLILVMASIRRIERGPVERALGGGAAALLALCGVAAGVTRGEWHWVYPSFIVSLPLLTLRLVQWPGRPGGALRAGSVAFAFLGVLLGVHAAGLLGLGSPLPSKDPTLRGTGWDRVARRAERLVERTGAQVIVTRSYQLASVLRFHLRDRVAVYEMGIDRASQIDRWPRPRLCSGEVFVWVLYSDHDLGPLDVHLVSGVKDQVVARHPDLGSVQLGARRLVGPAGVCSRAPGS